MIYQPTLRRPSMPPGRLLALVALIGAAGFVLFAFSALGLVTLAAGAGIMALIGVAAWRWPAWTVVFYAGFAPVNRFVILAILHFTGSDLLTKALELWKDGILAILVARVIADALTARKPPRLRYLDLLIISFLLLAAIYIVYPGPHNTDLFTRIQGFRTDASFLLAYFIGRGLHLERRHLRWILLALIPGSLAVAAVAAWQVAAPGQANAVFSSLGLEGFNSLQGSIGASTAVRTRGAGAFDIPRASSLQLGDLALAFYQLVLVSIAAALLFHARSLRDRLASGAFLTMMMATLAMTVTRSAIFAIAPVLMVMAAMARRFGRLLLVAFACMVVAVTMVSVIGITSQSFDRFLIEGSASSAGHLDAAVRSLVAIQENPVGIGLGTAGTIGQRYDRVDPLTNENWYLQIATEMGLLGAAIYAAITLVMTAICFLTYPTLRDPWTRALALGVGGASIGFLIVSNFLHAWENTVVSILFWLLAGIVVRSRQLEQEPTYEAVA